MKNIFFILLFAVFLTGFAGSSSPTPGLKIPVIMYHHIRDSQPDEIKMLRDLSCSVDNFRQHLLYLQSNGYNTITFADLAAYFENKTALPPKPVILTFDDGYLDNWDAFLDLKNAGLKGVFFIITGKIGAPDHLDQQQIKLMSASGMEIGSHTHDHYDLTKTKQTRIFQIYQTKKALEKMLTKPVISFCYPSGRFNQKILSLVKEAGYKYARSTRTGISSFTGNHYAVKTLRVHDYTDVHQLQKYLQ